MAELKEIAFTENSIAKKLHKRDGRALLAKHLVNILYLMRFFINNIDNALRVFMVRQNSKEEKNFQHKIQKSHRT